MDNREAKEWLESINFEIPSVKTQKAVMVAIQAIEELEEYLEFKKIFNNHFSEEALELLNDKKEFAKWLERGRWIAKRCDEINRELEQYRALGTVEETKQFMSEVHRLMDSEKMLVEYIKLGTLEQVREAVERMKPKKPIKIVTTRNAFTEWGKYECPNCKNYLGKLNEYSYPAYCYKCGCGIDWSVEE